jgi:hypothetical protein
MHASMFVRVCLLFMCKCVCMCVYARSLLLVCIVCTVMELRYLESSY